MTPTPVVLVCAFCITITTGCMDWSPTGTDQKQDFILSFFFLTIIDCPENENTDKQQATDNW